MLPQQATANYVSKSSAKYAINLEYFVSGILYALKNVELIFFWRRKLFKATVCELRIRYFVKYKEERNCWTTKKDDDQV